MEGRQKESGGKWGKEWRRGGETFLLSVPSTLSFFSFMNPWWEKRGLVGSIFEWKWGELGGRGWSRS